MHENNTVDGDHRNGNNLRKIVGKKRHDFI